MSTLRLVVMVALAVIATACTVTETGNPPFAGQMALTADTSDPDVVGLGGGTGAAIVEEAWVGIGDIRFVRAVVCDAPGETEVDVPGPVIAELVAEPAVVSVELAGDDYCRVRVPLDRVGALPSGAPPDLVDRSVVLLGRRSDGTPFRIASRIERESDVRSRGAPFELSEGLRAVVLAFDLALWLEDVDLGTATVDADGTIRVDDDTNRDLLDAFEASAERALRLFRDTDQDGVLDPEDRTELLAEAL
jgi:hypothetical protein